MGLKHIKLPSADVEFSGGKFTVRGLSLDDIAYLVGRYKDTFAQLFDQFQAQGDMDSTNSVLAFVGPMIQTAPKLAAEIIACGAGDASDWEVARSLPFPVQVEALEHVINLTFTAEGGPKKVLEAVVRLAQGTTALLETLSTGDPKA